MAKFSDRVGALKLILASSKVEEAFTRYQNLHSKDELHEIVNAALVAAERKAEQEAAEADDENDDQARAQESDTQAGGGGGGGGASGGGSSARSVGRGAGDDSSVYSALSSIMPNR